MKSTKTHKRSRTGFVSRMVMVVLVLQSSFVFGQDGSTNKQASNSEPLTLPLAVELALKTNPLTRATASGREMADAQVAEARAGRLPQVQLSETFANGNNPVFVFGSLLEQGRFTQQNFNLPLLNNPDPLTNFRFGVTVKAPVFDQWQSATRVKRAQLGQQQAAAQTNLIEQQVRYETLRAFYGLLLAQAKKEVSDEAVKLAESDVRLSRDRVEAGTSVVSDLLAAEVHRVYRAEPDSVSVYQLVPDDDVFAQDGSKGRISSFRSNLNSYETHCIQQRSSRQIDCLGIGGCCYEWFVCLCPEWRCET